MATKKKDDAAEEAADKPAKEPVPHTEEALAQLNKDQKASQDAYRDAEPNPTS